MTLLIETFETLVTSPWFSPWLFVLLVFLVLGAVITVCFTFYKLVEMLAKFFDKKSVKSPWVSIDARKDSTGKDSTDETTKLGTPPNSFSNEEKLLMVLFDVQKLQAEYIENVNAIKQSTLDKQIKRFKTESNSYKNAMRNNYFDKIKEDPTSPYCSSFNYWFDTIFSETYNEVYEILKNNHLNERRPEDFEDTIRQCHEYTFNEVLREVEACPSYIQDKKSVLEAVKQEQNAAREGIDRTMQFAKRVSSEKEAELTNLTEEFKADLTRVIRAVFPDFDVDVITKGLRYEL